MTYDMLEYRLDNDFVNGLSFVSETMTNTWDELHVLGLACELAILPNWVLMNRTISSPKVRPCKQRMDGIEIHDSKVHADSSDPRRGPPRMGEGVVSRGVGRTWRCSGDNLQFPRVTASHRSLK